MFQLELFHNEERQILKEEISKLQASNDRIRRSLFAKHGELAKNYLDLETRMEILERNICNGTYACHDENSGMNP